MIQRFICPNRFLAQLICCSVVLVGCLRTSASVTPATGEVQLAPTSMVQAQTTQLVATITQAPDPTAIPADIVTSTPDEAPLPTEISAESPSIVPPYDQISGIEINPSQGETELPWVIQAGAAWIRINALLWADVERVEGQRDWNTIRQLEDLLVSASEQGLQTILIVRGTPVWARKVPGSQCGPIRKQSFQAFTDFMADLVDRYSGPPYNVKYWEIWNEPDIDPSSVKSDSIYGCWGDQTDLFNGGQYYGSLLKTIYPQIKSANPEVKIVVGGLLLDCDPSHPPEWPLNSGQFKDCTTSRFLEGILESGAGESFDAVSFHAYDYYGEKLGVYGNLNWNSTWNTTGPVLIAKVEYLQGFLGSYGLSKELFNTENAIICGSSQALCSTSEFELTKAYYAALSLGAAHVMGVQANIWYSTTGWRSSGLFKPGYQPLPVFDSYRFGIQQLDRAAFRRVIDDYPGLSGYEFERDGNTIWLIWSLDDAGQTIQLPSVPDAVFDVFGTPEPPGRELTVTPAPIYLVWAP